MKTYSQVGQDLFVLSFFKDDYKGFFMDIGCQDPVIINNTLLLEENGWDGISFDIVDYSEKWKDRKTLFICTDVLSCDYSKYNLPKLIDYLSLDINTYGGARFEALKRIIDFGIEFKVITIEHDAYVGYDKCERKPQRKLLYESGYFLHSPNVANLGASFEDWWINPKYIIL